MILSVISVKSGQKLQLDPLTRFNTSHLYLYLVTGIIDIPMMEVKGKGGYRVRATLEA